MGAMSETMIDVVEAIEKTLCEDLCMSECQRTYEVALDIFNTVVERVDVDNLVLKKIDVEHSGKGTTIHINHVNTMNI